MVVDVIKLKPLPPEEAIEYLRSLGLVVSEDWLSVLEAVRRNSFTVAGVARLDMLEDIRGGILKALEEGQTLNDFTAGMKELFARKGWQGVTPYRLENIFRTNIQSAYNAGRYKQMTDPYVVRRRPIWFYSAVNDSATRPEHAALHGTMRRYDDPFWDEYFPPNGYRCRCTVRTLSDEQAKTRGYEGERGAPKEGVDVRTGEIIKRPRPDPGFAQNPFKSFWGGVDIRR